MSDANDRNTSRNEGTLEPLGALLHPLWLGALALLVINDHILKAALDAPMLTGKLSDVAGLIVAPALLAALVRVRGLRGLAVCAGAVAAVFAAVNVWPPAASAWDTLVGLAGGTPKTYTDPTDLLALPAAFVGTWMLVPAMERTASRRRRRASLLLAALGTLACLGSSDPVIGPEPEPMQPTFRARVAVLNKTNELQVLRVQHLASDAEVDCDRVAEAPNEYLDPEAFGEPTRWELASGLQLGLGGVGQSGAPSGESSRDCRAARISLETADDIVVFWEQSLEIKRYHPDPQRDKSDLGGPQVVELTADYSNVDSDEVGEFRERACMPRPCSDEERRRAAEIPEGATYGWANQGDQKLVWELPDRNERAGREVPDICKRPIDSPGLAWSSLPDREQRIHDLESGTDGCHALTLGSSDTEAKASKGREYRICAPWRALSELDPSAHDEPVHVRAEEVAASATSNAGGLSDLKLTVTRGSGSDPQYLGEITLVRGRPTFPIPDDSKAEIPAGCGPKLRSCGNADLPANLVFSKAEGPRSVAVGEEATLADGSRTLHLVRALHRAVSRSKDACESEARSPATEALDGSTGLYVEAVVVKGFSR